MKSRKTKLMTEATESKEVRLTRMFAEMNAANETAESSDLLTCETECTMARIRSYSDFLYLLRVKPFQTVCYYAAVAFFLLALSALWCSIGVVDIDRAVWHLVAIFGALCLVFATLPHNMRIHYFNKQAEALKTSYGKIINADFREEHIVLTVSMALDEEPEVDINGMPLPRTRARAKDENTTVSMSIPYKNIVGAYECSHSFYIFPVDEEKNKLDTIICDKTQFLCGTPMQLRDRLARGCGKRFRIKVKKA